MIWAPTLPHQNPPSAYFRPNLNRQVQNMEINELFGREEDLARKRAREEDAKDADDKVCCVSLYCPVIETTPVSEK